MPDPDEPPAPAHASCRPGRLAFLLAWFWSSLASAAPALWFPDAPSIRRYVWAGEPCAGCRDLSPRPAWERMVELAGLGPVRFLLAPDESLGHAYATAPNRVVLSPAALRLASCHLNFVVGHELAHLARRHFDEDAIALSVYSGRPADWTGDGQAALQLADGDFGLVLRVSHLWQDQEEEADWLGALLAAQASGCSLEAGAMAYLGHDLASGGGLAAAHAPTMERVVRLLPFAETARRLGNMARP